MDNDKQNIFALISQGENLSLEFKSDVKGLSDRELVAAIVALANTEGGDLLLGVEDDGTITGLHSSHQNLTTLPSFIASRTNPSVNVYIEKIAVRKTKIARISVPKSMQIVSTSDGLIQRRRLMQDGKPEAVPFYGHEFVQRLSVMGLTDPSAMVLEELSTDDFNPLERQRIREAVRKYGGDQSLLPLADNELDGALGLTEDIRGIRRPTMAGILLLGRENSLRQWLPGHEVAFQVLDGTDVRVNEFFRKPLLQTFEEIEQLFRAQVSEEEIQVGLFRVPIPNFDRRAFREAFVNALVHRDYLRLGAVHVRIDNNGLSISNPGGFVEGVTIQNLLVVSPRSRNPRLADIVKRIGLAERTGRGIDRIYEGMLRYGRPTPDFNMSDSSSVVLNLDNVEPDIDFLKMILTREEQVGSAMHIDSLILLSRLRQERRLTMAELAASIQKPDNVSHTALEKLVEAGIVEAHGTGRGRTYTLSARVYRHTGQKAAYIRQAGFDRIQQEQMVISYLENHGSIKRGDVIDLCRITMNQAFKLLKNLVNNGKLEMKGSKRGAIYTLRNK